MVANHETISAKNGQSANGSAWGEDYLKNVPEFSSERKFVKLEDIAKLYNFDNSMIFGHGTGSSGNDHKVVEDIFDEGVKGFESLGSMIDSDRNDHVVGSTDLSDNAVGLWSSADGELDFSKLKGTLDHWPHRNSENVILMRFPLDYYHAFTDSGAERTQAYFTEHEDKQGQLTHYIDRRFIIGNYNTETGEVELSPHFESEISDNFKKELDERLENARRQTEERQKAFENSFSFSFSGQSTPEENSTDDSDWDGEDW